MSEYCATKWDNYCEVASQNGNNYYPDNTDTSVAVGGSPTYQALTAGQILIHDTAARKYLVKMLGGVKKYEQFYPLIADSPMISYWVADEANPGAAVPIYAVNPSIIDQDPVMDKILQNPVIALDILTNIYNTMKRQGTLTSLRGTKIGNFFSTTPLFRDKGGVR